jgi:short-subunit dehydrogenase
MPTALVTGASAGLGLEYAKLFAADKHDVVLVARRRDRLDALAADLAKAHGITAHVVAADLGAPDGAKRVLDEVTRLGAEVEFLVNNAGFGTSGPFHQLDAGREMEQIRVNVLALVELTRGVLPGMVARGRGRILNIGSTAGFQPGPFMATYYATKGFVNSFSEALSHELRGTGVTATVSCPGPVATEFANVAGNEKSRLFGSGVATPADVAREAYHAMMAGRPMVVHGWKYRFMLQLLRVSPRAAVRSITASMNLPRDAKALPK